jgi:hypothetical protein
LQACHQKRHPIGCSFLEEKEKKREKRRRKERKGKKK